MAEAPPTAQRRRGDGAESLLSVQGTAADTAWLEAGEGDAEGGFDRIYRAFVAARAALGLALVLAQGAAWWMNPLPSALAAGVCAAYAAQAMALWLLPRFGRPVRPALLAQPSSAPWLGTIGVDLLAFSLLHLMSGNATIHYTPLLVLPLLMAGVLTPRLLALGTAAAVALMLLAVAWRAGHVGGEVVTLLAQAGLAGIGFFVLTLLAGELAGRLAREQRAARGSMALARQQAQLNRLVIEQMHEGVMVVDARGRVRTANPAARLLLGEAGMALPAPFTLDDSPAWQPLRQALQQAFGDRRWPVDGREVALPFDDQARTLVVRLRFTPPGTRAADGRAGELLALLFMEDLRQVQARMRDAKLAAMGRMSAGIAHEIRNPLAAITQANALLEEDALDDAQRLLTRMVGENAQRLKRIVDDVMEVAPGVAPDPKVFDARDVVAKGCDDWRRTQSLPESPDSPLRQGLPEAALPVRFEPDHLRRVLVNLLDNGLRHASGQPGSVRVTLAADEAQRVRLSVCSDGAPIAPEVERHLFEPFYSTRSRGTGLGLYICRELCERYGARIDYRLRDAAEACRNEFIVLMHHGHGDADAAAGA